MSAATISSRTLTTPASLTRARGASSRAARAASRAVGPVVVRAAKGDVLLEVKDLTAKVAETGETILNGVTLTIKEGETHAIMGKNGSREEPRSRRCSSGIRRTRSPAAPRRSGGKDLFAMEPEERARNRPVPVVPVPDRGPGGVQHRLSTHDVQRATKVEGRAELDPLEFYGFLTPKLEQLNMDPSFLARNVNEGFSGGEKKRNEILQLAVMESEMSILDEIDSGPGRRRPAGRRGGGQRL